MPELVLFTMAASIWPPATPSLCFRLQRAVHSCAVVPVSAHQVRQAWGPSGWAFPLVSIHSEALQESHGEKELRKSRLERL